MSLVDRGKVGCEPGNKSVLCLTGLTLLRPEIITFVNHVWKVVNSWNSFMRSQADAAVLKFLLY